MTEEALPHNNARVADGQGHGSLWGIKCFALMQGYFTRFLYLVNKNKGFSGQFDFQVNNDFLKHKWASIIVHNILTFNLFAYLKFKFKWTFCFLIW